jgi:hypothetical protein
MVKSFNVVFLIFLLPFSLPQQVKNQFIEHAFEISSLIFFIVPMTVICVLYILIGLKLRKSKLLYGKKIKSCDTQRCIKGQTRVIRMLSELKAFLLASSLKQPHQSFNLIHSCGCIRFPAMLGAFSRTTHNGHLWEIHEAR